MKNLLAFGSGPIDMVLLVCLCSVRIIWSTTNIGQISRVMNDCVVVWFLVWFFVRFGFGMIVSRSHRTIAYRTCGWVQLYPCFGLFYYKIFIFGIGFCMCVCFFFMIRRQVKVGSRNIRKKIERNEKPKCIKKRIKYSYSVGKYECDLRKCNKHVWRESIWNEF